MERKNRFELTAPWTEYYRKVEALFGGDKDITISYDDNGPSIRLFVVGEEKAEAIASLMPNSVNFGNVVLKVSVIPANADEKFKLSVFEKAFNGNPILNYTKLIQYDELSNPLGFVVLKKEVVQYYNDDLGDIHGLRSTLYEELMREVFGEIDGVFYCTDNERDEDKKTGTTGT